MFHGESDFEVRKIIGGADFEKNQLLYTSKWWPFFCQLGANQGPTIAMVLLPEAKQPAQMATWCLTLANSTRDRSQFIPGATNFKKNQLPRIMLVESLLSKFFIRF